MAEPPEIYKTPRRPGYLGSYNWRATTLGLFLLLVVSFVATQYVAWRFRYQSALGEPMIRLDGHSVYQPFAWVVWGWRHSTSNDMRIRRPLFEGELIVFAGSFLCVAVFYLYMNRKARKLSENADDLLVPHDGRRRLTFARPGCSTPSGASMSAAGPRTVVVV